MPSFPSSVQLLNLSTTGFSCLVSLMDVIFYTVTLHLFVLVLSFIDLPSEHLTESDHVYFSLIHRKHRFEILQILF